MSAWLAQHKGEFDGRWKIVSSAKSRSIARGVQHQPTTLQDYDATINSTEGGFSSWVELMGLLGVPCERPLCDPNHQHYVTLRRSFSRRGVPAYRGQRDDVVIGSHE